METERCDYKDKRLINKFPQEWRHPINTRFGCYRNKII